MTVVPPLPPEAVAPAAGGLSRRLVVLVPYLWLILFFVVPFFIVLKISFSGFAVAQPPYVPVFDLSLGWQAMLDGLRQFSPANYVLIAQDSLYVRAFLSSFRIALVSTAIVLLVGYPIAYGMARAPRGWRPLLLMLIILPFWTSFLIRVYAWIGILKREGLLNQFLMWTGAIDQPLAIINTEWAIYIGIVYSYLPFMVLPLYAALERLDDTLLEAAADLGATPARTFWQVTVPLSFPGIVAGCLLVFIPVTGEFVIPDLLGGPQTLMIGRTLWNEFFHNRDWPVASAATVVLLAILVVPIALFRNMEARRAMREEGR